MFRFETEAREATRPTEVEPQVPRPAGPMARVERVMHRILEERKDPRPARRPADVAA